MDKTIMLQFLKEFEQKILQMEDTVDNITPSASPDIQLAPEPIMATDEPVSELSEEEKSLQKWREERWARQRNYQEYKWAYRAMKRKQEQERKELHEKFDIEHRALPKKKCNCS